jgi:hypothetical protein
VSILAVAAGAIASVDAEDAPFAVSKVGDSLGEQVRQIFVPPTRATNPYASTAHDVFVFDSGTGRWSRIFHVPLDKGEIHHIAGYAKASQPLYVAYTNGVARTRDAGGEWAEAVPEDFRPGTAQFRGLSVSAADRAFALLAMTDRAWITFDFGDHWELLPLPDGLDGIDFGAIDQGSDASRLVLVSRNSVFVSTDLGANWTRLASPATPGSWASFGPGYVDLLSSTAPPRAYRLDLNEAAFAPLQTLLEETLSPGLVASDFTSRRDLWVPTSDSLLHVDLAAGQVRTADPTGQSPQALAVHPRKPGAIYYANGPQVLLVERLGADPAPVNLNLAYTPAESTLLTGQSASPGALTGVQSAVEQVMQTEPPLRAALAAFRDRSEYSEQDIREWKQRVRNRNWLPSFRFLAGTKDSLSTRYETVFPGTPQIEDIHLNDRETSLDSFTFEVEWQLRDLLFDDDEVHVSKESRLMTAQRNQIVREIGDLYYERIEALVNLRQAGRRSPQETLGLQIQVMKTTDLLNEICGQDIFQTPDGLGQHP